MAYVAAGKKRWKGLVVGVLGLVLLSMLVPLLFLLGIHNGFQGNGPEQPNSPSRTTPIVVKEAEAAVEEEHVESILKQLAPPVFKDLRQNFSRKAENKTQNQVQLRKSEQEKVFRAPPQHVPLHVPPPPPIYNKSEVEKVEMIDYAKGGIDESGKTCQVKFGSYCLWRQEHKEDMKDFMVKKLKDSLFVARSYFPTIAKIPSQGKFSGEMKQNIQELEKVLSESTTDADLPSQIEKKLVRMQAVISKAKTFPSECHNVDKKLRQIYDLTADEAHFT